MNNVLYIKDADTFAGVIPHVNRYSLSLYRSVSRRTGMWPYIYRLF